MSDVCGTKANGGTDTPAGPEGQGCRPETGAVEPTTMQLMLIGLWAIQNKTPTRAEMIEFYQSLMEAGAHDPR